MKKRLIVEIETEEDDKRIEYYFREWAKDNFQIPKKQEIKIEAIIN